MPRSPKKTRKSKKLKVARAAARLAGSNSSFDGSFDGADDSSSSAPSSSSSGTASSVDVSDSSSEDDNSKSAGSGSDSNSDSGSASSSGSGSGSGSESGSSSSSGSSSGSSKSGSSSAPSSSSASSDKKPKRGGLESQLNALSTSTSNESSVKQKQKKMAASRNSVRSLGLSAIHDNSDSSDGDEQKKKKRKSRKSSKRSSNISLSVSQVMNMEDESAPGVTSPRRGKRKSKKRASRVPGTEKKSSKRPVDVDESSSHDQDDSKTTPAHEDSSSSVNNGSSVGLSESKMALMMDMVNQYGSDSSSAMITGNSSTWNQSALSLGAGEHHTNSDGDGSKEEEVLEEVEEEEDEEEDEGESSSSSVNNGSSVGLSESKMALMMDMVNQYGSDSSSAMISGNSSTWNQSALSLGAGEHNTNSDGDDSKEEEVLEEVEEEDEEEEVEEEVEEDEVEEIEVEEEEEVEEVVDGDSDPEPEKENPQNRSNLGGFLGDHKSDGKSSFDEKTIEEIIGDSDEEDEIFEEQTCRSESDFEEASVSERGSDSFSKPPIAPSPSVSPAVPAWKKKLLNSKSKPPIIPPNPPVETKPPPKPQEVPKGPASDTTPTNPLKIGQQHVSDATPVSSTPEEGKDTQSTTKIPPWMKGRTKAEPPAWLNRNINSKPDNDEDSKANDTSATNPPKTEEQNVSDAAPVSPTPEESKETVSTSKPPPWMKGKPPAWSNRNINSKPDGEDSNANDSKPAWMSARLKKTNTSTSPPPWTKNKAEMDNPSSDNTPAWLKKAGQLKSTETNAPVKENQEGTSAGSVVAPVLKPIPAIEGTMPLSGKGGKNSLDVSLSSTVRGYESEGGWSSGVGSDTDHDTLGSSSNASQLWQSSELSVNPPPTTISHQNSTKIVQTDQSKPPLIITRQGISKNDGQPDLGILESKAEEARIAEEKRIADEEAAAEEETRSKEEVRLKAEEEARLKAEEEAKLKEEEEARLKAEEEARLKAEEEAKLKEEEEARLKAEKEARLKADEETRLKEEEELRLKAEKEAKLKADEETRLKEEEELRLKAEKEAKLKADEEARLKEEEELRQKAEIEDARLKAEKETRLKEEEESRLKAEEGARLKAEEETRLKEEEESRLKAEEDARLKAEEETRLKEEKELRLKAEEDARVKAEEARLKEQEKSRLKTSEEGTKLKEEEELRLTAEEKARLEAEEDARRLAQEEVRIAEEKKLGEEKKAEEERLAEERRVEEEKTAEVVRLRALKEVRATEEKREREEKERLSQEAEQEHARSILKPPPKDGQENTLPEGLSPGLEPNKSEFPDYTDKAGEADRTSAKGSFSRFGALKQKLRQLRELASGSNSTSTTLPEKEALDSLATNLGADANLATTKLKDPVSEKREFSSPTEANSTLPTMLPTSPEKQSLDSLAVDSGAGGDFTATGLNSAVSEKTQLSNAIETSSAVPKLSEKQSLAPSTTGGGAGDNATTTKLDDAVSENRLVSNPKDVRSSLPKLPEKQFLDSSTAASAVRTKLNDSTLENKQLPYPVEQANAQPSLMMTQPPSRVLKSSASWINRQPVTNRKKMSLIPWLSNAKGEVTSEARPVSTGISISNNDSYSKTTGGGITAPVGAATAFRNEDPGMASSSSNAPDNHLELGFQEQISNGAVSPDIVVRSAELAPLSLGVGAATDFRTKDVGTTSGPSKAPDNHLELGFQEQIPNDAVSPDIVVTSTGLVPLSSGVNTPLQGISSPMNAQQRKDVPHQSIQSLQRTTSNEAYVSSSSEDGDASYGGTSYSSSGEEFSEESSSSSDESWLAPSMREMLPENRSAAPSNILELPPMTQNRSARIDFTGTIKDDSEVSFRWLPPSKQSFPDGSGGEFSKSASSASPNESLANGIEIPMGSKDSLDASGLLFTGSGGDVESSQEPLNASMELSKTYQESHSLKIQKPDVDGIKSFSDSTVLTDVGRSGKVTFGSVEVMQGTQSDGDDEDMELARGVPREIEASKTSCLTLTYVMIVLGLIIFVLLRVLLRADEPTGFDPAGTNATFNPSQTDSPVPAPNQPPSNPPSGLPTPNASTPIPTDVLTDLLTRVSADGGASLRNPSSPQFAAMEWIRTPDNAGIFTDRRFLARYALATLYYSTQGEEWNESTEWLTKSHECDWFSARPNSPSCDDDRNIIEIDLTENNLRGTLPPELTLLGLEKLKLSGNSITGDIPTVFGSFRSLVTVELFGNKITGRFPSAFANWTQLVHLDIYDNLLTSSIPTGIGRLTELELLAVGSNQITGPIPSELGLLTNLLKLSLFNNPLVGTIPEELGRLEKLAYLYLDNTELEPFLPVEICSLGFLQEFSSDCDEIGGCSCCTTCCIDDEVCL